MEPKGKDQLAAARSSFGPLNDLRTVRSNGAVSLGELREFLGTLHGTMNRIATSRNRWSVSMSCCVWVAIRSWWGMPVMASTHAWSNFAS